MHSVPARVDNAHLHKTPDLLSNRSDPGTRPPPLKPPPHTTGAGGGGRGRVRGSGEGEREGGERGFVVVRGGGRGLKGRGLGRMGRGGGAWGGRREEGRGLSEAPFAQPHLKPPFAKV